MKQLPTINEGVYRKLIDALEVCQKVAIILHPSPDGDTIGSGLALCGALRQFGKTVEVVCQDEVPHIYDFLGYSDDIVKPSAVEWTPDIAIAVDVADQKRMGNARPLYERSVRRACIDHHSTNSFSSGSINYIRPDKGATCLLIYALIKEMGAVIDYTIAECIYIGITTDTGNFSFSNTSPEILRTAAELLETFELDIAYLTRHLFRLKRPQRLKLTARALNSLSFDMDGRIAIMRISETDFIACNAEQDDTEGLINMGMDCEGVEVAMLACEVVNGTKIGFRSQIPVDVGAFAALMGGGGHSRASGCTLEMPLSEAIIYIMDKLKSYINDAEKS